MYFDSIKSFPEPTHPVQLKLTLFHQHFIMQNLSAVPGLFHLASRPLSAPVLAAANMGAHVSLQTELCVDVKAVTITPTAASTGVHLLPRQRCLLRIRSCGNVSA